MKIKFLFLFLCIFPSIFCDQLFINNNGDVIRIHVVNSREDIDLVRSQEILVKAFMDAYEDVPLVDLSPDFKSIGDVRRFYENYFEFEFHHFNQGGIYWVQAFLNEKLVGWATFELEPHEENAAYMNLLIVDPECQKRGVGKHLVFSICSNELFPNISAINLLIRKVNTQGYQFYYNLGFFDFDYHRDNFVDTSVLSGLRWEL